MQAISGSRLGQNWPTHWPRQEGVNATRLYEILLSVRKTNLGRTALLRFLRADLRRAPLSPAARESPSCQVLFPVRVRRVLEAAAQGLNLVEGSRVPRKGVLRSSPRVFLV